MAETNFTSEIFEPDEGQFCIDASNATEWTEKISKLDWYDTTFSDSLDTCAAGSFGVLVAGAAFPWIACLAMMVLNYRRLAALTTEAFVSIFFYGVIASAVAITATMLGIFISIITVSAANASFGFPFRADVQIKWTGALTGFLCVGWLILIPLRESWIQSNTMQNLLRTMTTCMIVTFISMAAGHYGAIKSARRVAALDKWKQKARLRAKHSASQFKLAHMFSLTAWVAGVFAIQRLSGYNVATAVCAFFMIGVILIGISRASDFWPKRVQ